MIGVLRIFSPLIHPLGFGWLMLIIAFAVCLRRRRWLGATVCATATLVIWVTSQPVIAGALLRSLEAPWNHYTLGHAQPADAVIVLGGGWRESAHDFVGLDLTSAADRWITGVELCRRGAARVLVVGGDPRPIPPEGTPYSEGLRDWLRLWGFPQLDLRTLGPVASTHDEAERARELAQREGWRQILLVTSAFHMRRALSTFRKAGLDVRPVACDFQVLRSVASGSGWRVFPDPEAFQAFGLWWHEQLGWFLYRRLGYA